MLLLYLYEGGRHNMGYKILLVEDEIRMQEIIKDYFNAKGCEVICSYDGRSIRHV